MQNPDSNHRVLEAPLLPKEAPASARLRDEYADVIFKINTDKSSGTGWLAPGGWIVTSYHVIRNANWIDAIGTDGKRFKLGADLVIDDINDIALIKPVEEAAAILQKRRPLRLQESPSARSAQAGTLSSEIVLLGFPASSGRQLIASSGVTLGNTNGWEIKGLLSKIQQSYFDKNLSSFAQPVFSDAEKYLSRNILKSSIAAEKGTSGGPVLSLDGEVLGMQYGTLNASGYLVPGKAISAVFDQASSTRVFSAKPEFQPAPWVHQLIQQWENKPASLIAAGTVAGFCAYPVLGSPVFRHAAFALAAGKQALEFPSAFKHCRESTDMRDRWKFGLAATGDALIVGGFGAYWSMAALGCRRYMPLLSLGLGLASRIASDVVPANLRIGELQRNDATRRQPFGEDLLWRH